MISDVPVGVFLSGGYDSACVAALLQKDRSEKLKTFTIAVPDIGLNEAPYAEEVAKHVGTEHYEYQCSQLEALELITDLPYYYDEPFADSSAFPTMMVSRLARKHVTVALSGDGGDELFYGYPHYYKKFILYSFFNILILSLKMEIKENNTYSINYLNYSNFNIFTTNQKESQRLSID